MKKDLLENKVDVDLQSYAKSAGKNIYNEFIYVIEDLKR